LFNSFGFSTFTAYTQRLGSVRLVLVAVPCRAACFLEGMLVSCTHPQPFWDMMIFKGCLHVLLKVYREAANPAKRKNESYDGC